MTWARRGSNGAKTRPIESAANCVAVARVVRCPRRGASNRRGERKNVPYCSIVVRSFDKMSVRRFFSYANSHPMSPCDLRHRPCAFRDGVRKEQALSGGCRHDMVFSRVSHKA
eukprot:4318244-Prymnesium_polylepis.1